MKNTKKRYSYYTLIVVDYSGDHAAEAIRPSQPLLIGTQTTDPKTNTTIYFFPIGGGEAIRPSQPLLIGRQTTDRKTSTTIYFFSIAPNTFRKKF